MAKTKQQIIKYIIAFFILLITLKCASQLSPPGGDIDKIPPTIISTFPPNGTVNFNETEIEFSFSEYVNKRNINDAFFISPLIEGIPEFSWTNKTVYIVFPDSLQENTTYSVIIGTEISDFNNNNKMSEPHILTFSTGSKIDSGKINGQVYAKNADGTLIFAYKIDTGNVDIFNNKPNYLSQINDKGFYEMSGLGEGEYLLYAVKDEFKDLVYNIGDDFIGLPSKTVKISNSTTFVKGIDYQMQKEDTLSPNIQAATMTDRNHIVVEFDEPLDSSKLSIGNFTIHDSTQNSRYPIKYWFKTSSNKNEYILCLSDSLNEENELFLNAMNILDRNGNISPYQNYNFTATNKPDTNFIKIGKIETPYEKGQIDYLAPTFTLNFNDGFDTENMGKAISMFTLDSSLIPLKFNAINNASVEFSVQDDLKPNTQYTLVIDMKYLVDIAGNKIDTLTTKRISTVSDLDFSGASGSIKSSSKNIKVVLKSLSKSNQNLQIDTDSTMKFKFERVVPGEYLLWAYIDRDSNNFYSFGSVEPIKYAEFFKYYPDTLNLRARWPVGDIEIDLTQTEIVGSNE